MSLTPQGLKKSNEQHVLLVLTAVRFGRVPKREKAKILAAMQKVNQNSQEKLLNEQLEDENKLLSTILQAHDETCDYTREKVAPLVERARTQPVYAQCPPSMVSFIPSLR